MRKENKSVKKEYIYIYIYIKKFIYIKINIIYIYKLRKNSGYVLANLIE